MRKYPKIVSVKALSKKRLEVLFDNGITKIYDCNALIKDEVFKPLENDILFNCVKTDIGGHGISWNDHIDLSESELWKNGSNTSSQGTKPDGLCP